MRIIFIINGLSSKLRFIQESIEQAKSKYPDAELQFAPTKAAGDSFRIAYRCMKADSADVIVACGGDGTVNEVLNGVSFANENRDIVIGVYPCGSANDLVKTIGSMSIDQLIVAALKKEYHKYDIGLIKHGTVVRRFVNASSAGMGGLVFRMVESARGTLPPRLVYMKSIFTCILSFQRPKLKLTFNGKERELSLTAVVVGNGNFIGFGLGFTPQSKMNDESFGITILKHSSYYQLITKYFKLSRGEFVDHPWLEYHSAKSLKIEVLEGRLPIETDGEYFDVLDKGQSIEYSVEESKITWL